MKRQRLPSVPRGRPERFAQVLNECLDRSLVESHSVEACLEDYPEYAQELEPYLRLAADSQSALRTGSAPEAPQGARQRFQRTLQQARCADQGGESVSGWRAFVPRTRLVPRFVPAWAVAGAFLLALTGGTVTLASAGSLPGSPLYPVKVAREEAQLAFTFTPEGKAGRLIGQAESRGHELMRILGRDPVAETGPTLERLADSLSRAVILASDAPESRVRAHTETRVLASAREVLTVFDSMVLDSPAAGSIGTVSVAHGLAGAYSTALETLGAPGAGAGPSDALGGVHVQFAGLSFSDFAGALLLKIALVEAYRPERTSGQWYPLLVDPLQAEVSRPSPSSQVIAGADIPAGAYTRLRLTLTGAGIGTNGAFEEVAVAMPVMEFQRPFVIDPAQPAELTIRLNVEGSLEPDGSGNYALVPMGYLLKGGQPQAGSRTSLAPPSEAEAAALPMAEAGQQPAAGPGGSPSSSANESQGNGKEASAAGDSGGPRERPALAQSRRPDRAEEDRGTSRPAAQRDDATGDATGVAAAKDQARGQSPREDGPPGQAGKDEKEGHGGPGPVAAASAEPAAADEGRAGGRPAKEDDPPGQARKDAKESHGNPRPVATASAEPAAGNGQANGQSPREDGLPGQARKDAKESQGASGPAAPPQATAGSPREEAAAATRANEARSGNARPAGQQKKA